MRWKLRSVRAWSQRRESINLSGEKMGISPHLGVYNGELRLLVKVNVIV